MSSAAMSTDDPAPQWKPLVAAQSVEAGLIWQTPDPVTGLQIRKDKTGCSCPYVGRYTVHPNFAK